MQATISKIVKFSGIGLHNNEICNVTIKPSQDGIKINHIPISPFYVNNTAGMTTISKYSQVEHLMSALNALKIDNVDIFVDNYELPIMDGCSRIFVDKLKDIVVPIDKPKQFLNINQEVLVEMGESYIKYTPTNNNYLEIECIVDFPYVGEQRYVWKSNNFNDYYQNISNATTFFWDNQLKSVKNNGGAKGVNQSNTLILTCSNSIYFNNNEFAKHKLLDMIGDICSLNFNGKISSYRPGHLINNIFAKEIMNKSFHNMKVPFITLPNFNDSILKNKLENLFTKQNYIDTNLTLEFEEKLANYLNVKNVIAVNSGTSAIIVSLLALYSHYESIDDNSYVIVPRLTFWATYQAVKLLGKKVILVDVDEDYQMDINLVRKIIGKYNISIILTVHLYGIVSNNYNSLVELCHDNKIVLVEDSSQAFGSDYNNMNILTNSYISCVSMYPTKLFGSCGNAGFIVTSDDNIAKKMRSFRDNGRINSRYIHHNIGSNFVPNSFTNIFNIHKLEYMYKVIPNTQYKFYIYQKELGNLKFFKFPKLFNQTPNGFNFSITSLIPLKRDKIIRKLKNINIDCSIIYPKFIDEQPGFIKSDIIVNNNKKINLCKNILSLPIYYDMTPHQQNYVVSNIKKMDKINTIIIGLGNMGKKHAININHNINYNLLGYLDLKNQDNNLKLSRIDKIISDNIDLAIVTVNTENHYQVAKNMICKNINLLIEKPGLISIKEYEDIFHLINGIKIGVSMLERYNSFLKFESFKKFNKIEIYRITGYSQNFNSNLILQDLLIHDLDILVYYNQLDLNMIEIVSISRLKDIFNIKLKCCNVDIIIIVGNSNNISKREHKYYNDSTIEYNFINKENKIKSVYEDYINFILDKPNRICTLKQNLKLIRFIERLNLYTLPKIISKL